MKLKDNYKSIASLISGTFISQLIPFLFSPLFSRIYQPDDYAVFGVFSSIISIFNNICFLKYEQTILVAEDSKKALLYVKYCMIILFMTLVLALSCLGILLKTNKDTFKILIWILPIEFLLSGVQILFENYRIRIGDYNKIALSKIMKSLGQIVGQSLLGMLSLLKKIGLPFGYSIGTLTSLITIIKRDKQVKIERKSFLSFLKTYKRFPFFFFPGTLFNILAINITTLFLNSLYSTELVGYYSFAIRYLGMPVVLIGNAVKNVYIKQAQEEYLQDHETKKAFLFSIKILILSIPFFILFYFIAPSFFKMLYGSKWIQSGYLVQHILPLYFMNFLYSPISGICIIKQKEKNFLVLQCMLFISSILPYLISKVTDVKFMTYIDLYSLSMSLTYFIMLIYSIYLNIKDHVQ